ncbi:hypothetical protein F5148DRAFT_1206407 [Russula earlei]|uniref:Uncharacterized protein n=1 Tax=Russula earlei TaxID=71964 RepID=A0ACC0U718_9AGAM|nr:hypothetical protein F5148DRAFT_1206407 [Russula earlei]
MNSRSHSHSSDSVLLPSAGVQAYWLAKATPRFSLLDHLSTRGNPQELTTARRAIDDELSALHAIVCRMRSRRNDFSLIARLPPEILSCVFTLHAANQPPLGRDPPVYHSDGYDYRDRDRDRHNADDLHPPFVPSSLTRAQLGLGWITVTHVCRHWRLVALSNPNLWRTIVFDLGAEWAEEMLARSKAAPICYRRSLSFQPRVSRERALDDEVALRTHLSHVQRLALSGNADFLAPAVRALTTPAPHLESLELFWNDLQARDACVSLPSDLFSRQAPKLRHVALVGCSVPWELPLFRDLTHLEVRIPPPVPFPRIAPESAADTDPLVVPSLDRLLSILEAMSPLQVLILGNCLPRPDVTSRTVPLTHLTKLSLEGSLPESVAILKRLALPGSASLTLRCPDHNPLDGSIVALISLLSTHFRSAGTPIRPLSTLSIDRTDYTLTLTIAAWDTDISQHHPRFTPFTPPRLHLTFGCRHKALIESLPLQLLKALPLGKLSALSTTCSEAPWTPAEWTEVSSLCPEVAHVCVDATGAFTLAPTLMRNTVFPALVNLAFKSVNFFAPSWLGEPQPLCVTVPELLGARRDAGIPIRRLEIAACVVEHTLMQSFVSVVDDVIWDNDRDNVSDTQWLDSPISDLEWEWFE